MCVRAMLRRSVGSRLRDNSAKTPEVVGKVVSLPAAGGIMWGVRRDVSVA